jgi:hypothetical protein
LTDLCLAIAAVYFTQYQHTGEYLSKMEAKNTQKAKSKAAKSTSKSGVSFLEPIPPPQRLNTKGCVTDHPPLFILKNRQPPQKVTARSEFREKYSLVCFGSYSFQN